MLSYALSPQTFTSVDSLHHPEAVRIQQLLKGGGEASSILIDDEENIIQALKKGVRLERLFFTPDLPVTDALASLLSPDVLRFELARRTAKKLFQTNRWSRTFAVAQRPKMPTLADIADLSKDLVVLDKPSISGNVGSIIRTALAFNAGAVVLLDSDLDPFDRRLVRASRGYVFSLPVVRASTEAFLTFCRTYDWHLTVTHPHVSDDVHTLAKLQQRLAIGFGNEKEGCSGRLLEAADYHIRIPVQPEVDSLNLSVAAAIVLFQRFRVGV